ncbi:hypothetical protein J7L13_01180 [bacterium]|nr:hypothetical protein [bacterium]
MTEHKREKEEGQTECMRGMLSGSKLSREDLDDMYEGEKAAFFRIPVETSTISLLEEIRREISAESIEDVIRYLIDFYRRKTKETGARMQK